ncbi:MAG: hypothetical protein MZV65_28635 [Chromatiales bacterium]|nr:hypothetical protein [Chromatiales bacterium]
MKQEDIELVEHIVRAIKGFGNRPGPLARAQEAIHDLNPFRRRARGQIHHPAQARRATTPTRPRRSPEPPWIHIQ